MMKNTFYFLLKALSVVKISTFSFDFLIMHENILIRKIRINSKVMTSQPRKPIIAVHNVKYLKK